LKVFVVSAGALRTPLSKFVIVILVARVIRYFGEAYLGLHLGGEAYAFLHRHAWALLGSATATALGIYLVIRLTGARDESVL
jgi:membrane protein DedA with SNARE-associated domain